MICMGGHSWKQKPQKWAFCLKSSDPNPTLKRRVFDGSELIFPPQKTEIRRVFARISTSRPEAAQDGSRNLTGFAPE